jgi:hypothetical protein
MLPSESFRPPWDAEDRRFAAACSGVGETARRSSREISGGAGAAV